MGGDPSSRPSSFYRILSLINPNLLSDHTNPNMFGVTRMLPAFRALTRHAARQPMQVRKASAGDWRYRELNLDVDKRQILKADLLMTGFWYWILWHMWYDWDHFVGHGLPDPAQWTDEELGIPPDDAEP